MFRIFHSNLNDELNLVDAQNKTTETLMLDELDVGLRILETKYDEFVRGLIRTGAAHESFTARVSIVTISFVTGFLHNFTTHSF